MKKTEEEKILKEMDEALKENKTEPVKKKWYQDKTPETIHCRRCKTLMENGVCPTCGFKMYVAMDEKKRNKIRMIFGGACLIIFLVLYVILYA